MAPEKPDVPAACFAPHAGGEMAEMFDHVSGRYDFINQILSLGRDRSWREAMWDAIPENARAVLDLCTGSGSSLEGLRRPGRLVVGMDVSLEMLRLAAMGGSRTGWAPRLVCGDAFALPFRDGALDAVTIAFGIRNLRPRAEALAEITRVLAPGGTLAILEAAAPVPGLFAPFHRFYLHHVVPLAGRLSSDPAAYSYLAESVLQFDSPQFERHLTEAGLTIRLGRSFLLGATRLWVAQTPAGDGQIASISPERLHDATRLGGVTQARTAMEAERRAWDGVQALVAGALTIGLALAVFTYAKWNTTLPLAGWRRPVVWILLIGGTALFGLRAWILAGQWRGGPGRK